MKPPRTLSISAALHTRLYLAMKDEVGQVAAGALDICKVVSA